MGGRLFDCLESVIDRYRTEQIVEGHTLGLPVKKVRAFIITFLV
jgi:Ras GTPase-activating protein 1